MATKAKTYVLVPSMHPTAPIYRQVTPTTRVQLNRLTQWSPYLQMTIERPDNGMNDTLRLKLDANSIWQSEQVEKNIPANAKFTDKERASVKFIYGTLVTTSKVVQDFLAVHPQNVKYEGELDSGIFPSFVEYDKAAEIRTNNQLFRKRLEAGEKIRDITLKQAEDLLTSIYGSDVELPVYEDEEDRLAGCQQLLIDFLDSSDNAVNEILKVRGTVDDGIKVLMGKAIRLGVLSFDAIHDAVAVRRSADLDWQELKAISSELPPNQRQVSFGQFLTTEKGLAIQEDIRSLVEQTESGMSSQGRKDNIPPSNLDLRLNESGDMELGGSDNLNTEDANQSNNTDQTSQASVPAGTGTVSSRINPPAGNGKNTGNAKPAGNGKAKA